MTKAESRKLEAAMAQGLKLPTMKKVFRAQLAAAVFPAINRDVIDDESAVKFALSLADEIIRQAGL